MENRFWLLTYTHHEIQALLDKIKNNYSMTEEQYLNLLNTDSELVQLIGNKVHKIEGMGLSTEDFTTEFKNILTEVLLQGGINKTIHNVIDEDINSSEAQSLGSLLSNKVDKEEGKGLSTNDFANVYLQLLQEIRGHGDTESAGRSVTVFLENFIEDSIKNGDLKLALDTKSDVEHLHDDKYVSLEEGKALSTNDFSDNHKAVVDEILQEQDAKNFVLKTVVDDAILPDGLVGELLESKSDILHEHENYVVREFSVTKVDEGGLLIVDGEAQEDQISISDIRISDDVNNNILSVGDRVIVQERGLSDANLTVEEKAYLVQMLTNTDAVINALIANNILNGILETVLATKVDKLEGYSLVPDSEIQKLRDINSITIDDINNAMAEIFK